MVHHRAAACSELLVASLLLAVLLVVVAPFRRAIRSQADAATCVAARRLLVQALEQHIGTDKHRIVRLTCEQVRLLLPAAPACPCGGRYSFAISAVEETYADGSKSRPGDLLVLCDHDGHGRCRVR